MMRQSLISLGMRRGLGAATTVLLERRTGVCKTWIDQKGFGFVTDSQTNQDVFVHFREILAQQPRKMLAIGEEVEFDIEEVEGRQRGVRVTAPGGAPVKGGELDPSMVGRGRGGGRGGGGRGRGGGRGGGGDDFDS